MTTTKAIAEQTNRRHWVAWFVSEPYVGFGGDSSEMAIGRLIHSHPSIGPFTERRIITSDRVEFHFNTEFQQCPDCGGTGKYTGLNTVEKCGSCSGLGIV